MCFTVYVKVLYKLPVTTFLKLWTPQYKRNIFFQFLLREKAQKVKVKYGM